MIIHILEQLIDGLPRRQNINVYICNMNMKNQKLILYQILKISFSKERLIFITKKLNITEWILNINQKIKTQERIILHYLMYNMISIVRKMKMEHVHHLSGVNSVEIILTLILIFMKWNMIHLNLELAIVTLKYKWLMNHTMLNAQIQFQKKKWLEQEWRHQK